MTMRFLLAEREGFEPSVPARGTTVFETAPIDRSGTSPVDGPVYRGGPTIRNSVDRDKKLRMLTMNSLTV
jgi:hypothetical protein